jgi:TrmH family RNA methyltransferase
LFELSLVTLMQNILLRVLSKNKIKSLLQLSTKKQRTLRSEFLVEGPKLFEEALNNKWEILEVYATEEYVEQINNQPGNQLKDLKLFIVTSKDLQAFGNLESNKHVAALVKIKKQVLTEIEWKNSVSLILDDVRDPGNMGTIIRTASWFGIKNIFCSENCVDVFNPKVVQSSMGSVFSCHVVSTNIKELCKQGATNPDFKIFGAFMDGEPSKTINQLKAGFLILGSESHGISNEIEQYVSTKINIARGEESATESLNVAIANAILCYEITRK